MKTQFFLFVYICLHPPQRFQFLLLHQFLKILGLSVKICREVAAKSHMILSQNLRMFESLSKLQFQLFSKEQNIVHPMFPFQ